MHTLPPRKLRHSALSCAYAPKGTSFWTATWVPRLATLVVVAALAVVLLFAGLPVGAVLSVVGAVCAAAAFTGLVVATGRGTGRMRRAVAALAAPAQEEASWE